MYKRQVWNETIKEINESNNSFVLHLNVNASRDPTIENITFNPPHPKDGDDVTITAIVRNNGTKTATFMVDLWLNLTRNSSIAQVPNADWVIHRKKENRTSYIIHLKRENITLGSGKNRSVSAVWHNISVEGDPDYEVIAIVDPLDEIDEINNSQSDNEMRKEIKMNYPDLTVTKFISPSREDRNASVVIANMGVKNASNFTVRFEVSEYQEIEIWGSTTYMLNISKEGAENIRVHFKWLDARDKGRLEIRKNKTDDVPVKVYYDEEFCGWSPWVPGDSFWLVYSLSDGRSFKIDAIEWGEVIDENINGTIEAGGSVKIRIPPRWGDPENYTQPRRLKVIVDPYDNITELREDNNSKTGTIYIDLVADNITFVYPKNVLCLDTETNIIDVTIRNGERSADDIVLPASNFNISLQVKYLNESVYFEDEQTYAELLYAGESVNITFEEGKIYPPFEGFSKEYIVSAVVDANNNIIEGNDFYPWGEGNNETERQVTVSKTNGYKAKGIPLKNVAHGKLYGNIIYNIGNSYYSTRLEWEKPY